MSNPWFKFYGPEYLSDPKMLALSAVERSCWITLLSYACAANDNGKVRFIDDDILLIQSGVKRGTLEYETHKNVSLHLQELGMITISNEVITVKNWKKRQETSLTSYERVKRYREKKRNETKMITLDKSRIDKSRIEEIRIESCATPSQEAKDFFSKGKTYQELLKNFSKDRDQITIENELNKFLLYWTEKNKSGTKERWEQQSTFEVKRRLFTWFGRLNNFTLKKETNIL